VRFQYERHDDACGRFGTVQWRLFSGPLAPLMILSAVNHEGRFAHQVEQAQRHDGVHTSCYIRLQTVGNT
jgi:hypothetical protein